MAAAGDNDPKLKKLQDEEQRLGKSLEAQGEKIKSHKKYIGEVSMIADEYLELLQARGSWLGDVGGLAQYGRSEPR
ncbi:hypothetical protein DL766_002434 [Monosporascus sp. MC13-8B]|uniref:Uncharacterized protein n=1 Tax=Monosporascus cannonballus TaxID=155416 RepID=A0ABY0GVS7_9PEZI|nr:hypothetical protein DL762_008672 [Monosporascus cannonballus]RYO90701.1 hypothetical protein DL763_005240 [Monosporascus cannonballus]RYP35577.1 hypothetical protein DL766_002434 [Monosporascus sp. MC13-8B]